MLRALAAGLRSEVRSVGTLKSPGQLQNTQYALDVFLGFRDGVSESVV